MVHTIEGGARLHQDLTIIKQNIKFINKKLKEILSGHFVALRSPCFPIESFEISHPPNAPWRDERVHFLDEVYIIAAKHISFRKAYPPSKIEKMVNMFINSHSLRTEN